MFEVSLIFIQLHTKYCGKGNPLDSTSNRKRPPPCCHRESDPTDSDDPRGAVSCVDVREHVRQIIEEEYKMTMSCRDRVISALKQEPLDRPPVAVFTTCDTIDMMLGQGEPIGNICKRFKISRDTFAKFRKLYCRCPC